MTEDYEDDNCDTEVVGGVPIENYFIAAYAYKVELRDRWEYVLDLLDGEEVTKTWDSNHETYNGIQQFDKEQAMSAAKAALEEIRLGDGGDYFDELKGL